jgi:hypothetical protein
MDSQAATRGLAGSWVKTLVWAAIGGFRIQPDSGWMPGVKARQRGMLFLNSALLRTERRAGAWPEERDRPDRLAPGPGVRLPVTYIGETRLRIDFYRRLALAQSPAQVKQLENELRDRFGKFGEEVRTLLLVTELLFSPRVTVVPVRKPF